MPFQLTIDTLDPSHRHETATALRRVADYMEVTANQESPSKSEYLWYDGKPVGEWRFT